MPVEKSNIIHLFMTDNYRPYNCVTTSDGLQEQKQLLAEVIATK